MTSADVAVLEFFLSTLEGLSSINSPVRKQAGDQSGFSDGVFHTVIFSYNCLPVFQCFGNKTYFVVMFLNPSHLSSNLFWKIVYRWMSTKNKIA